MNFIDQEDVEDDILAIDAPPEPSFIAALKRGGINLFLANSIAVQGYPSVASFAELTKDDIRKGLIKRLTDDGIVVTLRQEKYLLAMRYWAHSQVQSDVPIDPALFTLEVANNHTRVMNSESSETEISEVTVKAPQKFTGAQPWLSFKEQLIAYLGTKIGASGVPYSYFIRKMETPTPDATYTSEKERRIATTSLRGPTYTKDNTVLFGLLQSLIIEGPGAPHIKPHERSHDGRKAWLSLQAHYESAGFTNSYKNSFIDMLKSAKFTGSSRNYSFDQYVAQHMTACQNMALYNEPINNDRQVRDFLDGISCPSMAIPIATVWANDELCKSVAVASNYLTRFVPVDVNSTKTRVVGEATTKGGNQGGGGGRGRGRGRGKGRSGTNNGGQGRGHGRGGSGAKANRHYSPEEYKKLTPDERLALRLERDARKIGALDTASQAADATSATSTALVVVPTPQGGRFGRTAHSG